MIEGRNKQLKKMFLSAGATALICMSLLLFTAVIPQSAIEKQVSESARFFEENKLFDQVGPWGFSGYRDNYADCILVNILYHIDVKKPVQALVSCAYYNKENENVNESLLTAVNERMKLNVDYSRYWHGSMVLLRPLFCLFSVQGVRIVLGGIILGSLLLLLFCMLRDGFLRLSIGMGIAYVAVSGWMSFFCIEYAMPFVMLFPGLTIWWILLRKKIRGEEFKQQSMAQKNRNLYLSLYVFVSISAILTCFVDFLTTETLSFTIPCLLFLVIREKHGLLQKWQEEIMGLLKAGIIWVASYGGMFLLKWLLAMLVIGKDAFWQALAEASLRINGDATVGNVAGAENVSSIERICGAFWRNIGCIYPFRDSMNAMRVLMVTVFILFICFCIWYLFHKKRGGTMGIMLLLLGMLPYARFLVLNNHSYVHFFFTYRAQFVTIAALSFFLLWTGAERGQKGRKLQKTGNSVKNMGKKGK